MCRLPVITSGTFDAKLECQADHCAAADIDVIYQRAARSHASSILLNVLLWMWQEQYQQTLYIWQSATSSFQLTGSMDHLRYLCPCHQPLNFIWIVMVRMRPRIDILKLTGWLLSKRSIAHKSCNLQNLRVLLDMYSYFIRPR